MVECPAMWCRGHCVDNFSTVDYWRFDSICVAHETTVEESDTLYIGEVRKSSYFPFPDIILISCLTKSGAADISLNKVSLENIHLALLRIISLVLEPGNPDSSLVAQTPSITWSSGWDGNVLWRHGILHKVPQRTPIPTCLL
jgi:hypothetical protein